MATSIQNIIEGLIQEEQQRGKEMHTQAVAYHRGRRVVNVHIGCTEASLFPVFSSTKRIATIMVYSLIEKGLLTLNTKVADIWPEFAQNGKTSITVSHLLEHTAGLYMIPRAATCEDLNDLGRMTRLLEAEAPLTQPGEVYEYHAVTQGYLLAEVIQRVSGKAFWDVLRETINDPLGVSVYIGFPGDPPQGIEILHEPLYDEHPDKAKDQASPAIPTYMWPLSTWANRLDVQRAIIPASNGIMSADTLAHIFAALLPGGINGVSLLPSYSLHDKMKPLTGFVPSEGNPLLGNTIGAFGTEGYGGSYGFADLRRNLAVGFTRNLLSGGDVGSRIADRLRQYVDELA